VGLNVRDSAKMIENKVREDREVDDQELIGESGDLRSLRSGGSAHNFRKVSAQQSQREGSKKDIESK
jgi:hypothetical protein